LHEYSAEVENETILIKVTEASERNELAKIENLPAKSEDGRTITTS
jgi:hypothetical protein